MGSIYCSNELGVNVAVIQRFAKLAGIPNMRPEYEYTTKEIANKLGMTEIEVNNLFQSAICKLRRKLDEKSNLRDYR
jgi:predicted transcriptional regulator